MTVVHLVEGSIAKELTVLSRSSDPADGAARQAEAVYQTMIEALAAEGFSPDTVVSETVFLRRPRTDFADVQSARSKVFANAGLRRSASATTFIGQAPLARASHLELLAVAVLPHDRPAPAHNVVRANSCSCDTCSSGARASVLRLADQTHLRAGNIHGKGRDRLAEAHDMFRVAEALLAEASMSFRDVIRTWIHLRDIDRDYGILNEARRDFFRRSGIECMPASTGVQGVPVADAHDFSMSLFAVNSPRTLGITPVSTPFLNEAPTYGADFSRALEVADGNTSTLYVSGTASIDEEGRTVHVGDFDAQVHRMLDNVESLLAQRGAGLADLVSGVAYLRNPEQAENQRSIFRERGFEGFPCALVEAPLCRPELLCEVEVVANLPLQSPGA